MIQCCAMIVPVVLMLVASAVQAAVSYSFTYADLAGNQGSGTLSCTDLGNGSLLATDGSFTLTASSDANGSTGTYSLITLLVPPGQSVTSPSGSFIVDNLIFPTGNAYGVESGIYVDSNGVLFGQPGTGSQVEVNFWGNNNSPYSLLLLAARRRLQHYAGQ